MLIISTATVSLLLVGVLAMLMTPSRSRVADEDAGEAIVTDFVTFAPAAGASDGSGQGTTTATSAITATTAIAAPVVSSNITPNGSAERTLTSPAVTSGFGNIAGDDPAAANTSVVAITIAGAVVVTPVGSGLAVTTESAVEGATGVINAVLPSGDAVVVADVVVAADGVVFVAVVHADGTVDEGMTLAEEMPPTDALYLSIGGTTMPVGSSAVAAMVIPEATPVLDADGHLVGLCTYGTDGIEVVPVGTLPELPATSVPATEVGTVTEPAVSSLPVTDAPTTPTAAPTTDPDTSSPPTTAAVSTTSTSTSTTSSPPTG